MRLALPIAAALMLVTSQAGALERVDHIAVGRDGTLRIQLDAGSVEVIAHAEPEVVVESEARGLGASSVRFAVRRDGDDVLVSGAREEWLEWLQEGPRVHVRARVPAGFGVSIATSGGDVLLRDLRGTVTARTSGGSIRVEGTTGSVEVETSGASIVCERLEGSVSAVTSGGRIDVLGVSGDVRAITSGGRISLSRVTGDVEAHTSGGPIEIDGVAGQVVARTSGGTILTRFTQAPAGRVETSGGGIEVAFPAHAGADLDAQTNGGRVLVEHEQQAVLRADPGRALGPINGGGQTLRLRTSGGSIHVRAL